MSLVTTVLTSRESAGLKMSMRMVAWPGDESENNSTGQALTPTPESHLDKRYRTGLVKRPRTAYMN